MMDDSSNFFKATPKPLLSTLKCILGNDINRLHLPSSLRNRKVALVFSLRKSRQGGVGGAGTHQLWSVGVVGGVMDGYKNLY